MKKLILLFFVLLISSCAQQPLEPTTYNLTTSSNPAEGGTVNPNGGIVNEGQQVSITASPSGYPHKFLGTDARDLVRPYLAIYHSTLSPEVIDFQSTSMLLQPYKSPDIATWPVLHPSHT